MVKRMLVPSVFLCLMIPLASPASAQAVTCSLSSTGGVIGSVPALPGVTTNASDTGHTEVGASGSHGIADVPGGGRVRISCANGGAAVNPGVVFLTVGFGVPMIKPFPARLRVSGSSMERGTSLRRVL